jgi:hypothetical protein
MPFIMCALFRGSISLTHSKQIYEAAVITISILFLILAQHLTEILVYYAVCCINNTFTKQKNILPISITSSRSVV